MFKTGDLVKFKSVSFDLIGIITDCNLKQNNNYDARYVYIKYRVLKSNMYGINVGSTIYDLSDAYIKLRSKKWLIELTFEEKGLI